MVEELLPKGVEIVDYEDNVLTEDDIRNRIETLRNIVIGHVKLKNLRTDDKYLLRFLHSCKFDVDAALQKMEDFYQLLLEYPQFYQYDSPMESKHLFDDNMRFILNSRDRDGRCLYLAKIGNVNPSKIRIEDILRLDDMWLESMMDDPMTQCKGFSVIVDIKGYPMGLLKWLVPSNLQFGLKKVESLPIADIIYHVVNSSFLLDVSLKIVWPFLTAKIKKQIKFHSNNWESLHKHIDPTSLPAEYGGTATVNYDKLNEEFLNKNNEIKDKLKYYTFVVKSNSIKY